jgi:hypothetical protein
LLLLLLLLLLSLALLSPFLQQKQRSANSDAQVFCSMHTKIALLH